MLWNKGPPDLSRLQRIAFFRGNVYMLYVAEIPKDRGFIPFFWAFEIPIFSGISVLIYKGTLRLVGKPFGNKCLLLGPQHIVDIAYLPFIPAILVLIDLSVLFHYRFCKDINLF